MLLATISPAQQLLIHSVATVLLPLPKTHQQQLRATRLMTPLVKCPYIFLYAYFFFLNDEIFFRIFFRFFALVIIECMNMSFFI